MELGAHRACVRVRQNRKQMLVELFERNPALWLAVSDVKNYYPSLTPGTIRLTLQSMGADAWLVDLATGFLQEFEHLPGTRRRCAGRLRSIFGVRHHWSDSIDRVFAQTMHFRLVDDLWSVAESEAEGHDHAAQVRRCLDAPQLGRKQGEVEGTDRSGRSPLSCRIRTSIISSLTEARPPWQTLCA